MKMKACKCDMGMKKKEAEAEADDDAEKMCKECKKSMKECMCDKSAATRHDTNSGNRCKPRYCNNCFSI